MTRLEWNELAFDPGPPGSGQLAALRAAAGAVEALIAQGASEVEFTRNLRTYVVRSSDDYLAVFPYNPL